MIPTRTMPEALAALVVYDPEADAADNAEQMNEIIADVRSGEVTRAIRASNSDAGPIAEGDWMGIVKGDGIVAVAGDVVAASLQLLEQLIGDEGELLTIITGAGADRAQTAEIEAWVATEHPDVQVETHVGGQPLYPYLFGVE